MRFLIDTQLPQILVLFLQAQGPQAEHVLDLGLAQSPDEALWRYAHENHSIIVTKDEDFADWITRGRQGPSVIWLRLGNCTNSALMARITELWPRILHQLEQNERLIELR